MTAANVDALRNSASDALEHIQDVATPAINEGKRRAGGLLDQSGELIDGAGTRASELVANLGSSVIAYTKKSPLTALLLAVGAGALLVGAATSASRRR